MPEVSIGLEQGVQPSELSSQLKPPLLEKVPTEGPEKLSLRQREAMARSRVEVDAFMERALTKDFKTLSKEGVQQWIERRGKENGLTPRQTHELKAVAREYIENNRLARELRDTYTNNRDLVRALTGMEVPTFARLSVRVGPWGLEISTDDKTLQHVFNGGQPPSANFHAGGFAIPENEPPFIFLRQQFFNSNNEILVHERQHVKYALNKHVMNRFSNYGSSLVEGYDLESSMRTQRSFALERVKDEVFAYYLGQGRLPLGLFQAQDGNPYDYLKFQRDFGRINGSDSRYSQASERIYVREYQRILQTAVARFDGLIQRGGYSSELAISLLVDTPLEQWERTIGEVLAEKGHAQQADTYNFPTKGWGTVEVQGKQVPLVDRVILPEDTQPNWYQEKSVVENDKKEQGNQTVPLTETVATEDVIIINQQLYQQTRELVNSYITAFPGEGLRRYFALLDDESKTLSKTTHGRKPTRKQLAESKKRILDTLSTYQPQPSL